MAVNPAGAELAPVFQAQQRKTTAQHETRDFGAFRLTSRPFVEGASTCVTSCNNSSPIRRISIELPAPDALIGVDVEGRAKGARLQRRGSPELFSFEAVFGLASVVGFIAVLFLVLQRLGARDLAAALVVVCGVFFAFSAAVSAAMLYFGGK
jgi:hypothetical protein